ncbi:MAG: hypothetical protein U0835_17860 [Isosphaeraceae bacterium]
MTRDSIQPDGEPIHPLLRRTPAALAVMLATAGMVLAACGVPGCSGDITEQSPALPTPASLKPGYVKKAAADPVDPASGLTRSELQTFYHLAEGSEVYPLAFLLALDDPKTGKPFLENLERFGLIPDPASVSSLPRSLPVGLTAAPSRDLRFANVLMVGVNCAACHVSEIEYQGKTVLRAVGAPNTLDLVGYYRSLAEASRAALATPSSAWTFLGRLYRMYRYIPPAPSGPSGPPGGGGGGGGGGGPAAKKKGEGGAAAAKKKGGGFPKKAAPAKSEAFVRESARGVPFMAGSASPQERELFGPPPGSEAGMRSDQGVAGLPFLHPDLNDMKKAGPLERAVAEKAEQLYREEMARPAPDFLGGLSVISETPGAPGTDRAMFKSKAAAAAKGKAKPSPLAGLAPESRRILADYAEAVNRGDARRLERLGPDLAAASHALRLATMGDLPKVELSAPAPAAAEGTSEKAAAVNPSLVDPSSAHLLLTDFVETIRLLRARAEFLALLSKGGPGGATEPGPGRVDAFGGARNLVFPEDPAPETAPINYPHIWGLEKISWYHWDGDTSSLVERNVGQALGTGAVLVKPDYLSTVIVPNIEKLERLAYKIRPPAWPEKVFGAIDRMKFRRGAAVFRERCAECHAPPPSNEKTADRLYAPEEIGTDPNRGRNFARPVDGKPFDMAIAQRCAPRSSGPGARPWRASRASGGPPASTPAAP